VPTYFVCGSQPVEGLGVHFLESLWPLPVTVLIIPSTGASQFSSPPRLLVAWHALVVQGIQL